MQDTASPAKLLPKQLPYSFAKMHGVIAIASQTDGAITVFHLPDRPLWIFAEIQRCLGTAFQMESVDPTIFQQKLAQTYESQLNLADAALGMENALDLSNLETQLPSAEDLLENQDDAPIIRLINAIFTQAIKLKASDIHIETYENRVIVRNRIDGVLQEVLEVQRTIAPRVISRVKVMAKLDIAEKRIPQDGRIALRIGGHTVDVRVSTLPSTHGERIVLRILDKQSAQLDLQRLGMSDAISEKTRRLITNPHGIILVTGPTGSGKTTSLYAMLTELNQVSRNILTIEDPIEYDLPGIGQMQVNTKVEMTFAKGLRAILRQDPDIVMIGEIRDTETAQIAVQASLTGHLVLSTLHTNTALGAVTRLQDMGIESFLLASSVIGLMAQRLVRTLCPHCKKDHVLSPTEKQQMGISDRTDEITIQQPQGCPQCNHSGYRGRRGIYEIITIDESLRGMIHRHESIQTMEQYIRPYSPSIRQYGFEKVLAGQTSLAEILRVTNQDS